MRGVKFEILIDKLTLCYKTPDGLFAELNSYKNDLIELDGFRLFRINNKEDETKKHYRILIPSPDMEGWNHLGTLAIKDETKRKGRMSNLAFINLDNKALYTHYFTPISYSKGKSNGLVFLSYICDCLGLVLNNITEVEIAIDTTINYVNRVIKAIRNLNYDMYLHGDKVADPKKMLRGLLLAYPTSRVKLGTPTIYVKQNKKPSKKNIQESDQILGAELVIYNKTEELKNESPFKIPYYYDWLGWSDKQTIYRVELTLRNSQIKDFLSKRGQYIWEQGQLNGFISYMSNKEWLLDCFMTYADRMLRFKNHEGNKLSILELPSTRQ